MTLGFVLPTFPPMAAAGIPQGDIVLELTFLAVAAAAVAAAVVASMFGGGGVEVCNIIALLGESWVLLYAGEFGLIIMSLKVINATN